MCYLFLDTVPKLEHNPVLQRFPTVCIDLPLLYIVIFVQIIVPVLFHINVQACFAKFKKSDT